MRALFHLWTSRATRTQTFVDGAFIAALLTAILWLLVRAGAQFPQLG